MYRHVIHVDVFRILPLERVLVVSFRTAMGLHRPRYGNVDTAHGIYPGLPARSPGTRAAPQSSLTEGGQS